MGDDPFNRSACNAARMIADYKPDHRGYAPDHYREENMAERHSSNYLVTNMNEVEAVFVFANSVLIVEKDGSATSIDRYNGQLNGIVTLGS